ncbi:concanavalin A-like lectin/glucanase domain-containing protein [Globomyces pollinis-pini]|nr:concanavalin A-like lectin/glucanase domain-containing protein [Globomyces pollinis-pini]
MKPGNGAKVSTTRYHLYGKFSVKFTAVGPGFVTDMITMSEVQDEIDWETTGPTPHAENNVFYHVKGKKAGSPESESGVHGGTAVPGGSIPIDNGPHTYEIDWKRTSITWSLDGKVVRTLNKAESFSKLNPKQTWFPDTPSILQFAVWQADGSPGWAGVPNWAGQTEKLANFENVNIQCYDESDKPVPFFPLDQKIINVVSNVTDSTTAVDSKTTGATGVATVTLGGGAAATGTAKPSQATATNAPSSANAVVSGLTSLLVSSALFALL